jgi:ABC-type nitrate/sulfonate/bicarbonate transport system permease component
MSALSAPRRVPRRRRAPALRSSLSGVGGALVILGIWQALSAAGTLPADSFPSMWSVVKAVVSELGTASGWHSIGSTMAGWGSGFAIGAAAAVLVGMGIGLSALAFRSTILVIEFMKTIPVIAILPLVMLEFGGTLKMEYTIVAFGVFWPLVIQVVYGVRAMDPVVRDTAEALRVTGLRRFALIVLPSAAPFIATGLRIAAGVALILAIIAELIGGAPGLGRDMLVAEDSGASALPHLYALIVITGLLGIVISLVFRAAERRFLRWHERFRPAEGADA